MRTTISKRRCRLTRLGVVRLAVGLGSVLVGVALLAQAPATPVRPAVTPPSAPAAAPPAGTPQIIRPTATLGPAPASPAAVSSPALAGQAAPAAVNSPRLAGVARYRSISRPETVMFDAPSDKARKLFVAPQGMPVEVVSVLRTWVKVRDPLGDLTWVTRDDLTDRRMLMATTVAVLRREAQPAAQAWFSVDRGVVLELLEERPVNGYFKVRYVEGQIGYIQPDQVWGI